MDFVLCYSLYSKLSRFKKKILNICEFRKVHSRYTYLFFSFAEKKRKRKAGRELLGERLSDLKYEVLFKALFKEWKSYGQCLSAESKRNLYLKISQTYIV